MGFRLHHVVSSGLERRRGGGRGDTEGGREREADTETQRERETHREELRGRRKGRAKRVGRGGARGPRGLHWKPDPPT